MKILHILYSGLGGHGNVFFSMVDGDIEKEHQYEVLFFGIEDVREGYIRKAEQRRVPWYFVKKKPGLDFKAYWQIEKIIKNSLPDIVFIHTSAYIFPVKKAVLTLRKKIKIIVRETQPNHLKTKREWVGLSFSLLFATKLVFLSTEYRDSVRKKLAILFSEKRTAVIPNGLDLDLFKPVAKTANTVLKIGMQSRLTETKDHATLIDSIGILIKRKAISRPIKLFIAGDGNCRNALEQRAKILGIADAVVFNGMMEETDLPGFINSLDIYIHATLGETMSTAIMQVMACKVPVIASDVPGVNNMVKHNQNGLLVPAQHPEALASAILQFVNDPEFADRLATYAYRLAVENYSNRTMFSRYNRIFNA